jgi:RES domain-containing protein
MTPQVLDRSLPCFRIGDPRGRFPIFDATGSAIAPGRWNVSSTPLIYACEYYSTALLEKLAHADGLMPPHQYYVRIVIPRGLSYETVSAPDLMGWESREPQVAKDFGTLWAMECRSLILIVPSVVARLDHNILINPAHNEFRHIEVGLHQRVHWDRRLFAASPDA